MRITFAADSAGSVAATFDTTIVYRSVSPATSNPALKSLTLFTTVRLAGKRMVSTSVEVLLAGFGSVVPSGAATVAVLTSNPVAAELVIAVTV